MADYRQYPNPGPRGRSAPQPGTDPQDRYGDAGQQVYSQAYRQQPQQRQYAVPASGPGARVQRPYGQQPYPGNGQQGGGRKKRKGGPWRVVFWIALVVFVVSLVALGAVLFSYWQGQNTYKEIANEAFDPPAGATLSDMKVDWDKLYATNPDTVGWIYVPGTVINYPIVHTTNNDKYLTTDFTGEAGWLAQFGTIFLSAENKPDFSDANNIVYGHHMNDGSMFAALDTFTDSGEFNRHRTVYILTPQGNYQLTTFSMVICGANDPLAQTTFADKDEMTRYIQDKVDRDVVVPDGEPIPASDMRKIFAFVTCDYTINNGRAVLFATVTDSTVPSYKTLDRGQSEVNPDDVASIQNAEQEI